MDVSDYYITTLTVAFKKIAPALAYLIAGYFIFIKLPFIFFLKSMHESKKKFDGEVSPELKLRDLAEENKKDFKQRMSIASGPKHGQKQEFHQEKKKSGQRKAEQKKTETKKAEPRSEASAEHLFDLKPGQSFTKIELRKKYHELLRQNHPDKVATLGDDFKALAEKKTKEINDAYEKLKKRAA